MGCLKRWCCRCCACCACWAAVLAVILGFLQKKGEELACYHGKAQRNLNLSESCFVQKSEEPSAAVAAPGQRKKRKYALTVYGATGFTGRFAAEYLAGRAGRYGITWAIAGRSKTKLEALRHRLQQGGWWGGPLAADAPGLPDVLAADQGDQQTVETLRSIAQQSEALVTFAGPYAQMGAPVVEACALEGTHYVDITGETFWVKRMSDQFGATARKTGAVLLFQAGYDSAPFDLMAMMVADAVAKAGDEPTEVRAVVLRSLGLMTTASFKSGLGALVETLTGQTPKERMCDPYLYLRGTPGFKDGCEVDGAHHALEQLPYTPDAVLFGRDIGPVEKHAVGELNSKTVRYSLHQLGYRNVSYGEVQSKSAHSGMKELMDSGALKPLDLLPQATVPEIITRTGYFTAEAAALGLRGTTARLVIEGRHGDPGYNWTAAMAIEATICLQDEKCRRPNVAGGFHTSVTAMGINLARRMQETGMASWSGMPV